MAENTHVNAQLPATEAGAAPRDVASAVLDEAHLGDIQGAFGTIRVGDTGARRSWASRLLTLLAIVGPGLIVMVGDNDAGGVATYSQAGQNFGVSLLWTLPLLIPVLVVNQEMVVRLGAVTGVGHARLINERFGKFWGAFSVGDLFLLNFLTIVTEFIGVSLALGYFGVSSYVSVPVAAVGLIAMTASGSFRRWERFMLLFVVANFLVIPLLIFSHPHLGPVVHGFVVPGVQGGVSSTAVLLVIAIVGTTVAPWQLFFQQSNIVDKRIVPRWINYERADTVLGSLVTVFAATLIIATAAFAFRRTPLAGHFANAGAVARGLDHYLGNGAGVLFALVLLNASIIGAAAVTLATSYAFGDVFGMKHSLHRGFADAKQFYASFSALVLVAAAIVLIPHAPLGLITTSVQALAGVLLPSATVFLLLLCNDKAVLGPWVNKLWLNVVAGFIVAVLVALSLVLMATTVFPGIDVPVLVDGIGVVLGACVAVAAVVVLRTKRRAAPEDPDEPKLPRDTWRMPPLALLERPRWSRGTEALHVRAPLLPAGGGGAAVREGGPARDGSPLSAGLPARPDGAGRGLRVPVPAGQRLRVAFLVYRGNPHCGGQGVYTRHLTRELTALGHEVTVFAGQPYPELVDGVGLVKVPSLDLYREPEPFRVPRPRELESPADLLELATMCTGGFPEPRTFSLRARRALQLRRGDFDLVHDDQSLGTGLLQMMADGWPVMASIHHPVTVDRSVDLEHATSWQRRLQLRRWYGFVAMQARVARRLPRILTVSESSRRDIVGQLGVDDRRIAVVPVGVDPELHRPLPGTARVPGRIMTTASADVPMKGLVPLLEALAKVRTDHGDAHLVVVGRLKTDSPVAAVLDRLGLGDAVRFASGESDERLVERYAEASVAVVPSLYEGFSLPAAEAMACGVPLVATSGGALPEVAGRDGESALIVPPGDPEALAGALRRLLDDAELRSRLGAAGRRRVLGRFTWQAAARGTAEQYEALLAPGPGARSGGGLGAGRSREGGGPGEAPGVRC